VRNQNGLQTVWEVCIFILVMGVTKMGPKINDSTAEGWMFLFWLRAFWLRLGVWLRFGYGICEFGYVLVTTLIIWLRYGYAAVWLRFGYVLVTFRL
jgi:hypothetical protein